jgi:hypothetical protein
MMENVTLTLTGAERCFVTGHGLCERYKQVIVPGDVAEMLLDRYTVDRSNNEYPLWEEGIVAPPPEAVRGRRVRPAREREEREDRKLLRQGMESQDPYKVAGTDDADLPSSSERAAEIAAKPRVRKKPVAKKKVAKKTAKKKAKKKT